MTSYVPKWQHMGNLIHTMIDICNKFFPHLNVSPIYFNDVSASTMNPTFEEICFNSRGFPIIDEIHMCSVLKESLMAS